VRDIPSRSFFGGGDIERELGKGQGVLGQAGKGKGSVAGGVCGDIRLQHSRGNGMTVRVPRRRLREVSKTVKVTKTYSQLDRTGAGCQEKDGGGEGSSIHLLVSRRGKTERIGRRYSRRGSRGPGGESGSVEVLI